MAAKIPWKRDRADALALAIIDAISAAGAAGTVACGDIARDPKCERVSQLCILGLIPEGSDVAALRERAKQNVAAAFPGAKIKRFKIYDYVELEDGNVSWLLSPDAQFGAAQLHANGPLPFVKMIEVYAASRGFKFGASGLKEGDGKRVTPTEESVFQELGVEYVPPGARESIRTITEERHTESI